MKGREELIDPRTKKEFLVKPFEINDSKRFSNLWPCARDRDCDRDDRIACERATLPPADDHLYGKYDQRDDLQWLYKREGGLMHPFDNMTRIKLILMLLESHDDIGARLDPLRGMTVRVCE